jgi:hypothetical protein
MEEIELRAVVDAYWNRAWSIKQNALNELVQQTYGGWTETAEEDSTRE